MKLALIEDFDPSSEADLGEEMSLQSAAFLQKLQEEKIAFEKILLSESNSIKWKGKGFLTLATIFIRMVETYTDVLEGEYPEGGGNESEFLDMAKKLLDDDSVAVAGLEVKREEIRQEIEEFESSK